MRAALVAAGLVLATATAARAGDPRREYLTIESDHFVVHYYRGLDEVARRVATVAEHAYGTLVPALDHTPKDKTLLVLVDDTDSANGFASVLPRNTINLFATAPPSFSELDDHDDWLYGLVAHELTHILHLDTMEGLPTVYNRLFGKTWAPNQVMPRWVIEGFAVYEESKRASGGRNRGTRFDQIIRIARKQDKQLRLDEVSGAPRQFPRGNAAYIYGSHFLRYIFDRYGDDAARAMSHTSGAHPLPFGINRQIAKVTGVPFTELYGDWMGYLRDRYALQEQAAERHGLVEGRPLTRTAEANFYPRYTADGKELWWLQFDGYSAPVVRAMPVGGDQQQARTLFRVDGMGPFDLLPDNSMVYEQGRLFRREYAYQDIFRWDARTQQSTRITLGVRARDPSASPDGRRVAFSMNAPTGSTLGVVDVVPGATPSVVWRGERYDQAYQPAWSPDGARIAFSAWRKGGRRDILVVELASGKVEEITRDRAIDLFPSWSPDGKTLYFDSDRTGIQNVFAYDTVARKLWQVTNVLGGAFRAQSSPDGKRLAFSTAVAKGGYDIAEILVERDRWIPARDPIDDRPNAVDIPDSTRISAPRRYRPLETLAPQAYTAQLELGDRPTLSLQTGGADAFNLHAYSLALATNLDSGELNFGGVYAYNNLRPSMRFAMSRSIGRRGGFRIDGVPATYKQEDWSWTLSSSIPFEARPFSSWSLSFDYDVDWFRLVEAPKDLVLDPNMRVPVVPNTDYVQAGVGARIGYSRVRGVTYGIGPQYGFDASANLRFDHPSLGAKFRQVTVGYAFNGYQRLFGNSGVLAARLTGSLRAGDAVRTGSFGLGGVAEQDVVRSIVDSTRAGITGYLRGYEARAVAGNQFHLLNLEYRHEVYRIERGLQTLPVYFRRITLAALSDTGIAFDNVFTVERNLRTSVGGALRLDAFFGYYIPGTFEIGYARGLHGDKATGESWFLLTGSL
ncbi:MAG: PD40 domain-containing protein [Deltaproteobacteria bacterium]|nr:PD40 domain-containing protein [Deltaproteobacteria bacterium]